MKTRLSVLSNGDCVSLDDVRSVRTIDKSTTRPKVELIYSDGIIIYFGCDNMVDSAALRDEIVAIVNEFEIDIVEQKEAEKLSNKENLGSNVTLTPVDGKV